LRFSRRISVLPLPDDFARRATDEGRLDTTLRLPATVLRRFAARDATLIFFMDIPGRIRRQSRPARSTFLFGS